MYIHVEACSLSPLLFIFNENLLNYSVRLIWEARCRHTGWEYVLAGRLWPVSCHNTHSKYLQQTRSYVRHALLPSFISHFTRSGYKARCRFELLNISFKNKCRLNKTFSVHKKEWILYTIKWRSQPIWTPCYSYYFINVYNIIAQYYFFTPIVQLRSYFRVNNKKTRW